MGNLLSPSASEELGKTIELLNLKQPFSFVRFSDGETEILRNRYLEIGGGRTVFRGRQFENKFPKFDSKKFDPLIHQHIRKDLLSSAMFRDLNFLKGIPTSHNGALKDREFLLRLNGGFEHNLTFSDLFLNSNYSRYRKEVVPLFGEFENIYVIANYRAKPINFLSKARHISLPDNFFATYESVLNDVLEQLEAVEKGALVLSSGSSLTNIVGHQLFLKRKDITFIDIGTSINDLLSLDSVTRAYHNINNGWFKGLSYTFSKGYRIKW